MIFPCKLGTHKLAICTNVLFTIKELVRCSLHAVCKHRVRKKMGNDLEPIPPIQSHRGLLSLKPGTIIS